MTTGLADDLLETAKECLASRLHQSATSVTLTFEDGTLLLEGTLSSFYLKQLAQEAVRRVESVVEITNRIEVRSKAA